MSQKHFSGNENEEGDIDGCEDVRRGEGAPVGGEGAPHAAITTEGSSSLQDVRKCFLCLAGGILWFLNEDFKFISRSPNCTLINSAPLQHI